jgi:hypothetical protein
MKRLLGICIVCGAFVYALYSGVPVGVAVLFIFLAAICARMILSNPKNKEQ